MTCSVCGKPMLTEWPHHHPTEPRTDTLPLPFELSTRDDFRCIWKGSPANDRAFDVLSDVLHAIRSDADVPLTLWNDDTGCYVMVRYDPVSGPPAEAPVR